MTVTPQPDRDSRYPDRYCTTCGKGFINYLECGGGPQGSGECNQNGVVPAEPANPDWNKPLAAAVDTILSAKACPNAPMNATLAEMEHASRPWFNEAAPIAPQVWEQLKSAHAEPKPWEGERRSEIFLASDFIKQAKQASNDGWTTDTKALARAVEITNAPHSGPLPDDVTQADWEHQVKWSGNELPKDNDGWTTVPIGNKSQT